MFSERREEYPPPPHGLHGDIELKTFVPIIITSIVANSASEGVVLLDDQLVSVGGERKDVMERCMGAKHAAALIRRHIDAGTLRMDLLRPSPAKICLTKSDGTSAPASGTVKHLGLTVATIDGVVRVVGLAPGGVAIRSGRLCSGCRILEAGGTPCGSAADVANAVCRHGAHGGVCSLELLVAHDGEPLILEAQAVVDLSDGEAGVARWPDALDL